MLWKIMSQHISLQQYLDFFVRIFVACACGAVIGVERSHRLKEAGVRTHLLVSFTAALIIIISKYGFADLMDENGPVFFGVKDADPARLAAQVVSAISFLCAGVIFKQGSMIKGLTTAAGLWATAGVGLAIGAGMYPLGIFTTIMVVMIQIVMHRVPIINDQFQSNHIEITVTDDTGFRTALAQQLKAWHAQVTESSITINQDGTTTYSLGVKMSNTVKQEDIYAFLEKNSSISFFRQTVNG